MLRVANRHLSKGDRVVIAPEPSKHRAGSLKRKVDDATAQVFGGHRGTFVRYGKVQGVRRALVVLDGSAVSSSSRSSGRLRRPAEGRSRP